MREALHLLLLLCVAAALLGCTSSLVEDEAPRTSAPQVFDFTKPPTGEEEGPVDPATCKHLWVPAGTHPYDQFVNGMPMMRLCFIIRCDRCGLERHECNTPRARP